ncbi:MAG TPA: hypothetical protein DCR35_05260 [Runella sp.]|nr:hypothetical protein [Runella sp.]HAO48747.1 hypothetical protein [Runella sp.]
MKYLALLLVMVSGLERTIPKTIPLSDAKKTGTTPRFTTDHRGRPVLSWVEKEGEKSQFFFAVSTDNGKTFGDKVTIGAPSNCSVHAEGMPRIAFKSDGTIFATFELKKPTKEAARASDLMYVSSNDNGQTWSAPKAIHRDTTPGKGHSFSDVTRLPNGELGFVWLDDKLGKYEGRSVKFVQTLPKGGFSEEVIVDSNACQCCRTVVFVDHLGQIHLTYRDLNTDGTRDMTHSVSNDGGRTFSTPKLVHSDLWKINACPHTGPSMAQVGKDLFVSWFSGTSANHEAGIRIAKLGQEKLYSSELSIRAKHPQSAAYQGSLAVVWDESVEKNEQYFSKIALRFIQKNGTEKTTYLSTDFDNASYPVLLPTTQGLLVAYELQKPNQEPVIVVTNINTAL